jgi:hypothetical protein
MGYRWPRHLCDATLLDIVLDGIASGRLPLHDVSDLEALHAWLVGLTRSHGNGPINGPRLSPDFRDRNTQKYGP